jgi:sRNA-binding carbon storage regulator CsrA
MLWLSRAARERFWLDDLCIEVLNISPGRQEVTLRVHPAPASSGPSDPGGASTSLPAPLLRVRAEATVEIGPVKVLVAVDGSIAWLGIEAPREVVVQREEVRLASLEGLGRPASAFKRSYRTPAWRAR